MAELGANLKGVPQEILPGVRVYPTERSRTRRGATIRGLRLAVHCEIWTVRRGLVRWSTSLMLFEMLASDEFREGR